MGANCLNGIQEDYDLETYQFLQHAAGFENGFGASVETEDSQDGPGDADHSQGGNLPRYC